MRTNGEPRIPDDFTDRLMAILNEGRISPFAANRNSWPDQHVELGRTAARFEEWDGHSGERAVCAGHAGSELPCHQRGNEKAAAVLLLTVAAGAALLCVGWFAFLWQSSIP